MNDGSPVVTETLEFNSVLVTQDLLQAGLPFVLVEVDNSTVCLPLLYSAMKHSTSAKAQKDISKVFKDISVCDSLQIFFFVFSLS